MWAKIFPPKLLQRFSHFSFSPSPQLQGFSRKSFMQLSSRTKFHHSRKKLRGESKIKTKKVNLSPSFEAPNFFHAIMGAYLFLFLTLLFCVFPCVFFGFSLLSMPLLFFNAVFVFLIFPLKGSLFHKFSLATMGNIVGFGWEFFSVCLTANAFHYFGGWSGAVFFVVNPFLELFWMVSMWALGLSILASREKTNRTEKMTWFQR